MNRIGERAGIKPRPRTAADFEWMPSGPAQDELAQAFSLSSEVASMLLHGLVATGEVRALDENQTLIDVDECKIWELRGKPALVAANELRDWLREHSTVPQGPQGRDRLILQKLSEGINPPRNITWKEFYVRIRDGCGGWLITGGKREPAKGFSGKQIQRVVNKLKSL
jgi:hypothetical protein